ncbi:MAG: GNAT family N-acetyltransferase [Acetobacteraceae bacterium]|nr:GNAT family N-acetyltransferase [Acetobacteraceae bacterium]
MTAGLILRSAVRADLPDIARLVRALAEYEREADKFTATEAEFDAFMFGPDKLADAVMAEIPNHAPVGIALYCRTISTFTGRIGLFLEDLFVEPDQRGKGIGRALMRHLAQIAVERNYNIVEWRVLNWNEPSIEFYEHLGATRMTAWHVRQLSGPALTALAGGAATHG